MALRTQYIQLLLLYAQGGLYRAPNSYNWKISHMNYSQIIMQTWITWFVPCFPLVLGLMSSRCMCWTCNVTLSLSHHISCTEYRGTPGHASCAWYLSVYVCMHHKLKLYVCAFCTWRNTSDTLQKLGRKEGKLFRMGRYAKPGVIGKHENSWQVCIRSVYTTTAATGCMNSTTCI